VNVEHALELPIPHAEKLVLVYLASRANFVGVGAWDRDELERALGYKRRSAQRLLKSLRDRGILSDIGEAWYELRDPEHPERFHASEHTDQLPETPPAPGGRPMTLREIMDDEDGGAPVIDGREVGDQIAQHVIDAADYLVDQLNTFEQRFAGHIDRFAMLHVERGIAEPPGPPPDPVRESERYREMIAGGIDEATAYSVAEKLLQIEAVQPGATEPQTPPDRPGATNGQTPTPVTGRAYPDTPAGRCQRVADILAGGERTEPLTDRELAAWQELEASENKHSVKGEISAFEQLYPAIVSAARANPGMGLEAFAEVQAALEGRAPWDRDPAPSRMEDSTLEAEIQTMLAELDQANDPRCVVQPRITETAEDGSKRQETIDGYHRRVSAVYKQMQRLKAMGAM